MWISVFSMLWIDVTVCLRPVCLSELPPQILSSDGVVYRVTEGGSVKLHCEVFGSPRPHITW